MRYRIHRHTGPRWGALAHPLLFSRPMLRGRVGLALASLTLVSVSARPAEAYDPKHTHRWIARKAIEHLVALYPGQYDELLAHTEDIVDGAEHEDDALLDGDTDPTTLRVMRHFYRPTDEAGLEYGDKGRFPSSYEWGARANEQNDWDWGDALDAYQRGDRAEAYFAVGHVVHLISDLTVPAHAHLDAHGPPTGDDYEGYCSSQMRSEFDGDLALPAAGTPLPEVASLADLWQLTARASYWRNMYPGDLSDADAAAGVIAEMFPELAQGWLSNQWEIPGLGALGSAFHEERPGWFYFERNGVAPAVDRVDFDVLAPQGGAYAHNADGALLTARMADDLVPVAVLHSAAVLKMFADEAAELPPLPKPDDPEPAVDDAGAAGCAAIGSPRGAGSALLVLIASFLLARPRRRIR